MLFNHLYFSDLPDSRLELFLKKRIYSKIIAHKHFNPRIIENISKLANSRAMNDDQYIDFLEREFNDPSELWKFPFNREISSLARIILLTLWSFNGKSDLKGLKAAVNQGQNSLSMKKTSIDFDNALRQIDGNFITTDRYRGNQKEKREHLIVQFHNPSIEEFVQKVALSDIKWIELLVASVIFIGQAEFILNAICKSTINKSTSNIIWENLLCRVPYDHIPTRSYPLFKARAILEMILSAKGNQVKRA